MGYECKQVVWKDEDGVERGGIMLPDGRIMCGCCGHIVDPLGIIDYEEFSFWVDIEAEIAEGYSINNIREEK